MKRSSSISTFLLGLVMLLGASSAPAAINTVDNVPAATLLLPYFEVDTANANGVRTVFTVATVSPTEQLAHVTLWTDRGVPTYTFDVRLPGFGLEEIDLGALFTSGTIPSSTAGGFTSCSASLPPANLTPTQLTGLRNAHAGIASSLLGNQCGGATHGDSHARGYVTIDVVRSCSTSVPGDSGYFISGGTGVATNSNVLWGEQSTSIPSQSSAWGDTLVHIEASATDPATDGVAGPGGPDYTFYGRRLGGSGADNREGLPEEWQGSFSFDGAFTDTLAEVWRDPGVVAPFACATAPAPLGVQQIGIFDMQEEPTLSVLQPLLPYATQSISLSDPGEIGVPYMDGVMSYNLGLGAGVAPFATKNQAFVAHRYASTFGSAGKARTTAIWPITQSSFTIPISGPPQCSDGIDNDGDGQIDFPADTGCRSPLQTAEAPECSDGIDNDGDGFTDWPADPECYGPNDLFEAFSPQCDDGIDNDADGFTDWPADPRCFAPNFNSEAEGICGNGIDDDGDGFIDFPADPGCQSRFSNTENPTCTDGIDNDGDGFTDFPADTGCETAFSATEAPICRDGIDNDGDGFTDFPADIGCATPFSTNEGPACNDGIDNDGDGFTDFPTDPGCASPTSLTESPACNDGVDNDGDGFVDYPADLACTSASGTSEGGVQCRDGIDNDGNGVFDYPNDPGCTSPDDGFEGPDCSDTEDNDRDGLVDMTDPGCASPADLNELSNTTTRECSDGIDNNGDGFIDFPADPGCSSAWDDVEYSSIAKGAPVIDVQPPTIPNGIVGTPYTQLFTATGGFPPYTFSVSAGTLPAGLTLVAGGTLSGTPTLAGTFNFTIRADDSSSFNGTRAYTLIIDAAPVIVVQPPTIPNATLGVAYTQVFTASGGTAPYTFTLSAGVLPAGMGLATDGTLSGAPLSTGSFNFTVQATDATTLYNGTRAYTLVVGSVPVIDVQPLTVPNGSVGVPYNQVFTASGGTAPYTFAVAGGSLPPGMTLAADGTLSGTPLTALTYSFTIQATDAASFTGTRAYTLLVSSAPVIDVLPPALANATLGTPYAQTFSATGGLAPYTFALSAGALPPGLTLSASGALSGTPSSTGAFGFTIQATDATTLASGTRAYTLQVFAPSGVSAVAAPTLSTIMLLVLMSLLGFASIAALRRT